MQLGIMRVNTSFMQIAITSFLLFHLLPFLILLLFLTASSVSPSRLSLAAIVYDLRA